MSQLTATDQSQQRESAMSLALVVVVLTVLALVVPFAVLVAAPGLLLVGVRTVRRVPDGLVRTLGWLSILLGTLLIALTILVVVGLMAWSVGGMVEAGPPVMVP